ncbi:MFS transporter [Methylobacterium nonmethylotrophicum]|uniref:MFS transporter n=2 Tax=Methylobacterium nonmethylotrophicum TaxID=1141884 RepID=A0A4Z0NG20_9HYPH|nr:MFS transporter [Methylobacterium nonmethylotrophicum]
MCVGQVGNLLPHVVVQAIMAKHLIPLWGLSASEAGMMAGAYAFGYMLAVPVLATLSDRIDARKILGAGTLVSMAAVLAFPFVAHDLLTASLMWGLAGLGFAGAYMPGLKALTDRLDPGDASRSVTLYTSSFSLGVALSFLIAQVAADRFGWQSAFLVTGLGPAAMLVAVALMAPVPPPPAQGSVLSSLGAVFRNRPALGYILGYGAHCFELYGMRTWIVAFWTFVAATRGGDVPVSPVTISVLFALLSMPSSVLGNELALRTGRHRAISAVQVASAVVGLSLGFASDASPWLTLGLILIYAVTIPADSGALTAGMAQSAAPGAKGATMALHSTIGFGLSALGGWGFGLALDAAGGPAHNRAWLAGFTLLSFGIVLGPVALWWSRRRSAAPSAPLSGRRAV